MIELSAHSPCNLMQCSAMQRAGIWGGKKDYATRHDKPCQEAWSTIVLEALDRSIASQPCDGMYSFACRRPNVEPWHEFTGDDTLKTAVAERAA